MGQAVGMIILLFCLPFIALPLLTFGLILLMSKTFWILVGLGFLGYILYERSEKKEKGYLKSTAGYISLEGVDPSKLSLLRLYPDKLTVNDIQIIPIERVEKADSHTSTQTVGSYRNYVHRDTYHLTITYKNKDGKTNFMVCRSKQNQVTSKIDYIMMKDKINEQIGYTEPPETQYPDKPYEL